MIKCHQIFTSRLNFMLSGAHHVFYESYITWKQPVQSMTCDFILINWLLIYILCKFRGDTPATNSCFIMSNVITHSISSIFTKFHNFCILLLTSIKLFKSKSSISRRYSSNNNNILSKHKSRQEPHIIYFYV